MRGSSRDRCEHWSSTRTAVPEAAGRSSGSHLSRFGPHSVGTPLLSWNFTCSEAGQRSSPPCCSPCRRAQDPAPIRGFTVESSRAERELERRFREIPRTDSLRSYMKRLSARPQHLGSPYGKDNSEWLVALFKSWGLDARIEEFEVLFPTPEEPRARDGGADPLRRQTGRTGGAGRRVLDPAEGAAPDLQRVQRRRRRDRARWCS